MITYIHLQNFRIFDEDALPFELSPLTVLCGTNSAGKSTLFKALLLLRQSQGIRETYAPSVGRLRFVGSQVDLGSYVSVVSHNDTTRDITLSLGFQGQISSGAIERLRSLKERKKPRKGSKTKNNISYELRCCFTFVSKRVEGSSAEEYLEGLDWVESSTGTQGWLKKSHYELLIDGECLLEWIVQRQENSKNKSAGYSIKIPFDYFSQVGGLNFMDVSGADDGKYISFVTFLRGLLPDRLLAKRKADTANSIRATEELSVYPLPPLIEKLLKDFRKTLTEIHYLGPLRSPAERYYVANLDATPSLDARGDFLPYMLRDQTQPIVRNCSPISTLNSLYTPTLISEKLDSALNKWLCFFRTGDYQEPKPGDYEIKVDTTKEVLVEFKVKTVGGGEAHALADSGFGYSQILPILVRGLLAEEGAMIIVEQPELHLNPALQVRLAEFFVAMIRAGKQIVIETHSEHIVNTIRVLVAEDDSKELASKCQLWFIDAKEEKPHVYKLDVDENGMVSNWPRQFFGEALTLSSRLLKAQKRGRAKQTEGKE